MLKSQTSSLETEKETLKAFVLNLENQISMLTNKFDSIAQDVEENSRLDEDEVQFRHLENQALHCPQLMTYVEQHPPRTK